AMACGPATTPNSSTMNSWLFPPRTRAVQLDEKWSFVAKKEKHVDPADPQAPEQGDQWDHVALDPEHRLVLSVVVGKRTAEHTRLLLEDLRPRTGGLAPRVTTGDENPAYAGALVTVFGQEVTPPRTGRPRAPYRVPPAGAHYATVHKRRQK